MAGITKSQVKEIRSLVRRMNRRIERAAEQRDYGQVRALEYYVQRATGQARWSAATKGKSEEWASAYIEKLKKFAAGESTTRKGWKALKKQNIRDAIANLRAKRGGDYTLTEEELAEALEVYGEMYSDVVIHTKEQSRAEFYYVVNKVQAAKNKAGGDILDNNAIVAAMAETMSEQDALDEAIKSKK